MNKLFLAGVVAAAVAPLAAAVPQNPSPSPAASANIPVFDVVSVKVNRSGADRQDMRLLPGGRLAATNVPLRRVILTAYGLLPQQLTGAPDWIETDRFDIVAQATEDLAPGVPGGPPGRAQLMMQRLLAERFNLAAHTETRELPIYELVVARADGRLGPRMSPAKIDCTSRMDAYSRGQGPSPAASECGGSREPGRLWMRGASVTTLARSILTGWTERIVEDHTGLTGDFDLDLEFTPDSGGTSASTAGGNSASLFTALEEQLGLKLRPARGRVQVLVIDRVQQPTKN
jgi:uncharacterized protein (TIGR03435 family)